jgi:hypothetical protein
VHLGVPGKRNSEYRGLCPLWPSWDPGVGTKTPAQTEKTVLLTALSLPATHKGLVKSNTQAFLV